MEIYLVGGAVRDKLLNIPVKDRDWVVVGSTPDEMLKLGYLQVGKDFPVFLHPQTKEEYALARTEKKSGHGYHGFTCNTDKNISLLDDLTRRDLTINAIAESTDGQLIDPFNGISDIKNGLLRHISPAFKEDPVRILRTARFAARFSKFGFNIAHETHHLMKSMVQNNEVDHLVPERIWAELSKALEEQSPSQFFRSLESCGALDRIIPEISQLFTTPQSHQHHPEGDAGTHTLMVLDLARQLSDDKTICFAALCHDLGKGITAKEYLPKHPDHETNGQKLIKQICRRLKVPNQFKTFALIVAKYHTHLHKLNQQSALEILTLLEKLSVFKQNSMLEAFITTCIADTKGRKGFENTPYPQADLLRKLAEKTKTITSAVFRKKGLEGKEIGIAIHQKRLTTIENNMT
ncbi:MAG: multifunctional CCA addition/repair protein [Methylococcales bacterium]|nr:multifunctional CCA addition/repair protein [Methylococcales bacterium]MBT7411386.1 multifunctional CCA addition/repair protein [Methylococcales bacterium]